MAELEVVQFYFDNLLVDCKFPHASDIWHLYLNIVDRIRNYIVGLCIVLIGVMIMGVLAFHSMGSKMRSLTHCNMVGSYNRSLLVDLGCNFLGRCMTGLGNKMVGKRRPFGKSFGD